jgi:hypothetical protein
LASIEDDAWADELRVVWELEPGTVVHDVAVLPSPEHGFDEPSELAAFLHAVRWGAIASADTTALQAPFLTQLLVNIQPFRPVAGQHDRDWRGNGVSITVIGWCAV